ncbi:MAG TPA: phospholipase D-like domain-containing protein [Usitatibacter sp.]|nr:phospholipase D-like domain-containing protein [Usitatibacter sp.]
MKRIAVLLLACTLAVPALAERADVQAAFTPGDNIAAMIVQRIQEARSSVRMQAYLFTDRRIANALVAALRRGVRVEVIADGAQEESGGAPYLHALRRAGARIFLASGAGAAHNKVVIVDSRGAGATTITGSYNFTRAANAKNAENVVVISGSPGLARRFVENFDYHRGQARPWP